MKKSLSFYVTLEPVLKLRERGTNVDRMIDEFLHFQAFGQQSKEARMGGLPADPPPQPEEKPKIKLDSMQLRLIRDIRNACKRTRKKSFEKGVKNVEK